MDLRLMTCLVAFTSTHNTISYSYNGQEYISNWFTETGIPDNEKIFKLRTDRQIDNQRNSRQIGFPFFHDQYLGNHQGHGSKRWFAPVNNRKTWDARPGPDDQPGFNPNGFLSFGSGNNNRRRTTTERPSSTTPSDSTEALIPGMGTTRSPCEDACLTTSEYNPVCGDNMMTYFSMQRLNCAIRCGKQVRMTHQGACSFIPPRG